LVRRGQVFRSAGLHRLAGTDIDTFAALGIRVVYDLRTAAEREARPDTLPAGMRLVPLDVLADSSDTAAAHLGDLTGDVGALRAHVGAQSAGGQG
jgi:protein-tyrosine phosphatase